LLVWFLMVSLGFFTDIPSGCTMAITMCVGWVPIFVFVVILTLQEVYSVRFLYLGASGPKGLEPITNK
jgi:hypothetical protein